jgi:hypothetical protein
MRYGGSVVAPGALGARLDRAVVVVDWWREQGVHDAALDQGIRRLGGHQDVGQGGEDGGILEIGVWHLSPRPFHNSCC